MRTYTIKQKMSNSGSIHDIASDTMDRVIKFRADTRYAVVLAAYYGGKGYRTFTHADDAARAYLAEKSSCELIDYNGTVYNVEPLGHGDYKLYVIGQS